MQFSNYDPGADMNGDGKVDATDLGILGGAWMTKLGDARYDPRADVNRDGSVDGTDFGALARSWLKTIWSQPETYSGIKNWTLLPGDGVKTVYARVMDVNGTWSSAFSDTIILDTMPPTGSIIINNGDNYTVSVNVTLGLSATDALSGMITGGQMQFSNYDPRADLNGDGKVDGVDFSMLSRAWLTKLGDARYDPGADANGDGKVDATDLSILGGAWMKTIWSQSEPYGTTMSWTLFPGNGTKRVYARFRDAAGSWSEVYSDTIILSTS
jgi:hypothetical protein